MQTGMKNQNQTLMASNPVLSQRRLLLTFYLAEEEPEPEVDLSIFLERQRLTDQDDRISYKEEEFDDGIDHSLSNLPLASSSGSKTRKNKTQTIQWDASMDQLKQEKEAAEAVWG